MLPFARFLSPFYAGGLARLALVGLLGLAFLLGRPMRLVAQEFPPLPRPDASSGPTFSPQATSAVAEPPLDPADFETGIRPDTAPLSSPQAPPATQVEFPPLIRSDKTDTRSTEPESSRFDGWTSLLTTASSLAVVLGLFLVTAWILRRAGPRASRALPTEALEVLGRTPLAGRQQMVVLRFGRRLLLVSVTPDSSETLTEITDPAEVDYLAGLCTQSLANSSTTAFRQVFERFTDRHKETHLEETGPEAPVEVPVSHGAEVS